MPEVTMLPEIPAAQQKPSAFRPLGFKRTVARLIEEVTDLYKADGIPWVIGYSGGKDSTATLQLVWLALSRLSPDELRKPVHVISTDTLVENPIVSAWVARSLEQMGEYAAKAGLPLTPHRLTPAPTDSFWVNLIGRGYPAPRPKFRWCTERLKINPSNRFISEVVRANGEAVVVLGTRKAESQARARSMERLEGRRVRERLSPNGKLPNSYVYTPVEDWSNDDVWVFLMQVANPWGFDNKDLLTMYQGASSDGECPLVIDTTTPSCGDSRFGCWVCTLVEKDKSMQAMISNDQEKEWMLPLLDLRNELDIKDDSHLRDFRRMNGSLQLYEKRDAVDKKRTELALIPGPYVQDVRERWLRRLLEAQQQVRDRGPEQVRTLELITNAELQEIRRIWVLDKHEIEDNLPSIYEATTGEIYPGLPVDDNLVIGGEEVKLLREVCEGDRLHFEATRELLDIERRHRSMARRAGLFKELERALRKGFYEDADDARRQAVAKREAVESVRSTQRDGELPLLFPLAEPQVGTENIA